MNDAPWRWETAGLTLLTLGLELQVNLVTCNSNNSEHIHCYYVLCTVVGALFYVIPHNTPTG